MAKSNSGHHFQGTLGNFTFVNSNAYGDHVRKRRSSSKVNQSLRDESAKLQSANLPARIFKNAIDPYREDLRDGQLWQRLVAMFHKQLTEHACFDFSKLEPFDLHRTHTLNRIVTVDATIRTDQKTRTLDVELEYFTQPKFRHCRHLDGYRFTIIALFPDLKKKIARTAHASSDILSLKGKINPLVISLMAPAKATTFAVCLKIDGYIRQDMNAAISAKGICMIGAGKF